MRKKQRVEPVNISDKLSPQARLLQVLDLDNEFRFSQTGADRRQELGPHIRISRTKPVNFPASCLQRKIWKLLFLFGHRPRNYIHFTEESNLCLCSQLRYRKLCFSSKPSVAVGTENHQQVDFRSERLQAESAELWTKRSLPDKRFAIVLSKCQQNFRRKTRTTSRKSTWYGKRSCCFCFCLHATKT